jgi:hypothetical protein
MPMNRVQFQPGLSMREFLSLYGTEEQCEAALIARRWPEGFVCPGCGVGKARTTFQRQNRRSRVRHQTPFLSGFSVATSMKSIR